MILSRRVALNGVQLDELDPRIVIRSIEPGTPRETITAVGRMGGAGQRITTQHYDTLDTVVAFAIDIPKTDLSSRRAVWESVVGWANNNGWLTVNYMPGRQMYVDHVTFNETGDMWQWTNEFRITFRAYNIPFWQGDVVTSSEISGTSGSVGLAVPGNRRTVVDISATNISGMTINTLSFYVSGQSQILLEGVGLGGYDTLNITHGTNGVLRIRKGSSSALENVLTSSSDDLFASPGNATITFSTGRSVRLTASCRGRWF